MSWPEAGAAVAIVALLVVTPLLVVPDAKETFRLVQGLAAGWLGLASLAVASVSLWTAGPLRAAAIWRRPAVRALTPLAAIVAAGGLFTSHPVHFRAAFADFAIGVACVIGWSLALGEGTLRRLLAWTIPPAVLVAALGLDQFTGWFGTLDWLKVEAPTARLRLTSTVGNPGDLAALLVLPTLVALSRLATPDVTRHRGARVALAGAMAVMLTTIAITATLAAAAAVVVSGAIWWWVSRAGASPGPRAAGQLTAGRLGSAQPGSARPGSAQPGASQLASAQLGSAQPGSAQPGSSQPGSSQLGSSQLASSQLGATPLGAAPSGATRSRATPSGAIPSGTRSPRGPGSLATALLAVVFAVVAIAGALAVSAPLRTRVIEKASQLARGDVNALLTGRLDAWRAAWAMLGRAPLAGVGHGAFRAEYVETRLALEAEGVSFYREQQQVVQATPHNEALSVAAEQGVPGLIALGWALWCVIAAARAPDATPTRPDRALVWAGLAALGILCAFSFPMHVASIAWPWLLFLAWAFRRSAVADMDGAGTAGAGPAGTGTNGTGTNGAGTNGTATDRAPAGRSSVRRSVVRRSLVRRSPVPRSAVPRSPVPEGTTAKAGA